MAENHAQAPGESADIILPQDCGNSPRLLLVGDLIVAWARGDRAAVEPRLADDFSWSVVGAATDSGPHQPGIPRPGLEPERIEILSTITHGRLAACDGFLADGPRRVDFCHVLHFTGASKTARIAAVRTYLQPSAA
ncbi:hypothetical protein [Arthrobacter sp.]|uniref:hypothetical protein n=1 Tax=Arthrobacter sp. TaxID=1667 RepID=UPI003A8D132A